MIPIGSIGRMVHLPTLMPNKINHSWIHVGKHTFHLINPSWDMDVSKNRGKTPKMDGENNGSKPYEQMDDLEGFSHIFGSTPI